MEPMRKQTDPIICVTMSHTQKARRTKVGSNSGPLEVGAVIAARFQLSHFLYSSESSEIWLGRDLKNEFRMVAIKVLNYVQDSSDSMHRFADEGIALELLNAHPNIVKIYQRGRWRGLHYIAMEYIAGITLDLWIDRMSHSQTLPDAVQVSEFYIQICSVIAYGHALRLPGAIIHRDIKPGNILLLETPLGKPMAKVLDFGIARLGRRKITRTGQQIGTCGYMSPEQAAGDCNNLSPASDVFSLGLLMVELLSLQRTTPNGLALCTVAVQRPQELVSLLCSMRTDIPRALWMVAARALQPQPAARYRDAGQLLADCQMAMRQLPMMRLHGATLPSLPEPAIPTSWPPSNPYSAVSQTLPRLECISDEVAITSAYMASLAATSSPVHVVPVLSQAALRQPLPPSVPQMNVAQSSVSPSFFTEPTQDSGVTTQRITMPSLVPESSTSTGQRRGFGRTLLRATGWAVALAIGFVLSRLVLDYLF